MNTLFLQWLIGFIDAEGNFQTTKKLRLNPSGQLVAVGIGYSFHMGLSMVDLELLNLIRANLGGIGTMHLYPNKGKTGEAHFAITRRPDLIAFLGILFAEHSLLTAYQTKRLGLVQYGLLNNIKKVATPEEYDQFLLSVLLQPVNLTKINPQYFANWLIGFINGEAYFTTRGGLTLEHTDLAVLQYTATFLGISSAIRHVKVREGRKPTYELVIRNQSDVKLLVNFLENNQPLKGNKLAQYLAWKKGHGYL